MKLIQEAIQDARSGSPEFTKDQIIQQAFVFPREFVGFSGHFPGEPILPAVVQISLGVFLAGMLAGQGKPCFLILKSVPKAKFVRKLKPDELITAKCSTKNRDNLCFEVALSVDREPASRFVLECYSPQNRQCDA